MEYVDTGIFPSLWRFFLLFRFYFILFFPIALVGVVVGLSTNIVSYFILEDVLNEFPFRSRTFSSSWSWRLFTFAVRDSLISANKEEIMIISLLGKKNRKSQYFNLNLNLYLQVISPFGFQGFLSAPSFYYLSHLFSIVDRRYSSTGEEILIHPLEITPIWKSQHPDRQRKQLRNFFSICYYVVELFVTCSFFQDRWDMGT